MISPKVLANVLEHKHSDLPLITAVKLMTNINKQVYGCKEASVDAILAILVNSSKENNCTVCELLSSVVEQTLMSEDGKPYHINGIEFVQQCDTCLTRASTPPQAS